MRHEIIDITQTAQSDVYIVVSSDGRITLHTETGEQKIDEELDFGQLQQRNPHIAAQAEAALQRLRERRGEGERAP